MKMYKVSLDRRMSKSFDHIKFLLSNPPILQMPDMTGTSD